MMVLSAAAPLVWSFLVYIWSWIFSAPTIASVASSLEKFKSKWEAAVAVEWQDAKQRLAELAAQSTAQYECLTVVAAQGAAHKEHIGVLAQDITHQHSVQTAQAERLFNAVSDLRDKQLSLWSIAVLSVATLVAGTGGFVLGYIFGGGGR